MSTDSVTLRQLIAFKPENDREKEIFNIHQHILDDMNNKLQKKLYYLGGQIKMDYDDKINLELFNKVRDINKQREIILGGPCNSWEAMSIYQHKNILDETEKIVKKYFEIMNLRENDML
jgi:hypothetical protein